MQVAQSNLDDKIKATFLSIKFYLLNAALVALGLFSVDLSASPLSPESSQQLITKIQETFRMIKPDANCNQLNQPTNERDYCENLDKVACAEEPSIRLDRTGGVIMPPRTQPNSADLMPNEVFKQVETSIRETIGPSISSFVDQNTEETRKAFSPNLDTNQLKQCMEKVLVVFIRANRHQFTKTSSTVYQYWESIRSEQLQPEQIRRYLGENCTPRNQADLANLLVRSDIQDLRKAVDTRLFEGTRDSETMRRIKSIFPSVKEAASRLIQRSSKISDDHKGLLLQKIENTRLGPCNTADSALFGNFMTNFSVPGSNRIHVCAGAMASCRSDFCIAQLLTHELAHSIDGCNFSSFSNHRDLIAKHPLGSIFKCVQDQLRVGDIPSGDKFCSHPHPIKEAFCDHVGSQIVAEYFKDRKDRENLTENDFRRGFANSWICFSPRGLQRPADASHPLDHERLRIIMNSQPVRELMNCRPNSTSQKRDCRI
jgi:hypothetical protein